MSHSEQKHLKILIPRLNYSKKIAGWTEVSESLFVRKQYGIVNTSRK